MIFLTAQGGILGPFCWLLGKILNWIYVGLSSVGIENLALCIIIFTLVELGSFLDIILLQKKLDKSCFAIFLTFLYIFSGVLNDS